MAKPDIWMPLYIGDYLADTMHLTTEQHGAYLLLIMAYWKNGGALSSADQSLAATCRLGVDAWSMHKHTLASFFDTDSDPKLWIHMRAEKEMEKAGNNQRTRTLRAQAAAAARWGNNAPSNAASNAPSIPQAMLNGCPSPSPSPSSNTDQDQDQKLSSSGVKKPRAKKPVKPAGFSLPEWVDQKAWDGFLEMRKLIKKPISENGMGLALGKLERLAAEGHDPNEVLDQSTFYSWQGLFEIKQEFRNDRPNTGTNRESRPSLVERVRQANAHLFDEPPPIEPGDWPEFDSIREIDGQVVDPNDRDVWP